MNSDSEEEISHGTPTPQIPIPQIPVPQIEGLSPPPLAGKQERAQSAQFVQWLQQFNQETAVEKKIRLSLDFMRSALSQGETPRFKDFWEGKRLCLPLFKESLPSKVRAQLWAEYVELSDEARRLKTVLDEKATFAIEQIELAIQGIERDLENFATLVEHAPDVLLSSASVSLKERIGFYDTLQKELYVLNTLAMRVNDLRKEIIKTEMRIRIKNKLLERISVCGDSVFPKRKESIKAISQAFVEDIDRFVSIYFQTTEINALPLHVLREEIKVLQSIAKVLTLNTQAFSNTRLKLSECWDKIREQEKERKKEVSQRRESLKQNYDLVLEKIREFTEKCHSGISAVECAKEAQEILDFMRATDLGKEEIRELKDALNAARKIVTDREKDLELERTKREIEIDKKRREEIDRLKDALNTLLQQMDQLKIDVINEQREELSLQFQKMSLSKVEKQIIDRLFKQLRDALAEKKERAILDLSEDDLKSLEQLRVLLNERCERRQEVKGQLEQYRKALGGSGFDFEKAMMYRELIENEKMSLEKINNSIQELEDKIDEIGG